MKFLIVGPGAMGLLFSSRLKMIGEDVFLLDYKKERADYLNRNGIKVEGIRGSSHVYVPVITKEEIDFLPDFVMIFVKSYSTRSAAYEIKDAIGEDTCILTLQNGVGNIEVLGEVLKKKVYGGITAEGATLISTGHIKHAGSGDTIIGPVSEKTILLKEILNRAGFKTDVRDDVDSFIWGKLLINVGINALTAITRLKNGMIFQIEETRKIMKCAVKEAMEVVEKKGISLPYKDPVKKTEEVCKKTSGNISSMLQDILSKKITEIDSINGAIVREAERLGIDVPVNRTITYLIRAIQRTYKDRVERK